MPLPNNCRLFLYRFQAFPCSPKSDLGSTSKSSSLELRLLSCCTPLHLTFTSSLLLYIHHYPHYDLTSSYYPRPLRPPSAQLRQVHSPHSSCDRHDFAERRGPRSGYQGRSCLCPWQILYCEFAPRLVALQAADLGSFFFFRTPPTSRRTCPSLQKSSDKQPPASFSRASNRTQCGPVQSLSELLLKPSSWISVSLLSRESPRGTKGLT